MERANVPARVGQDVADDAALAKRLVDRDVLDRPHQVAVGEGDARHVVGQQLPLVAQDVLILRHGLEILINQGAHVRGGAVAVDGRLADRLAERRAAIFGEGSIKHVPGFGEKPGARQPNAGRAGDRQMVAAVVCEQPSGAVTAWVPGQPDARRNLIGDADKGAAVGVSIVEAFVAQAETQGGVEGRDLPLILQVVGRRNHVESAASPVLPVARRLRDALGNHPAIAQHVAGADVEVAKVSAARVHSAVQ